MCQQQIRVDLRRQLTSGVRLRCTSSSRARCETCAAKYSRFETPDIIHNSRIRARKMRCINLWNCHKHEISTESILEKLDILPIDKIFYT